MHSKGLFLFSGEVTKYLISQGLEVNKKDKFGRTPLYYALASYPHFFSPDKVKSLLLAGAKIELPKENFHFQNFYEKLYTSREKVMDVIDVMLETLDVNAFEKNSKDILKLLMTSWLQRDKYDKNIWLRIQSLLQHIYDLRIREAEALHIFTFLHRLLQNICSDLGIKYKLLDKKNRRNFPYFKDIFTNVELLKYLAIKGVALDVNCRPGLSSYLNFAIKYDNFESVSFFLSIGAKPKKSTLKKITSIDPRIKQLVEKSNKSVTSLQNIARLKIYESLDVEDCIKKAPHTVDDFIAFRR